MVAQPPQNTSPLIHTRLKILLYLQKNKVGVSNLTEFTLGPYNYLPIFNFITLVICRPR